VTWADEPFDLGLHGADAVGPTERIWLGEFACRCHLMSNANGSAGYGYTQFYFRCAEHAHMGYRMHGSGMPYRVRWPARVREQREGAPA
jgi:hypothetical protein